MRWSCQRGGQIHLILEVWTRRFLIKSITWNRQTNDLVCNIIYVVKIDLSIEYSITVAERVCFVVNKGYGVV